MKKKKSLGKKIRTILIFLFVVIVISAALLGNYFFSPVTLSQEQMVTIPEGYSIIQTGKTLEEKGLVRSAVLFRVLAQLDKISIKAGTYLFSETIGLTNVIERLRTADYGDVYTSVTLPEGTTTKEMAEILKNNIDTFDSAKFIELAKDKEGYLFPDTYSFLPGVSTETIFETLIDTFDQKVKFLRDGNTKRSWQDIVVMASLIEKEATGDLDEQKKVSGILWKRLDEGKLLQIDAPFKYINGKVVASDLRKDGPYNTYTRKGLTPTPIGNPGLTAIDAAVNPISTSYYFYLHGKNGQVHYSANYNGHINNINRYLR